MRTIYLRKEYNNSIRKILIDMAYLAAHKKIRLLKFYFEDGLYLPYQSDNNKVQKYFLDKEKIKSEDENHFFFDFPFTYEQVKGVAE